MNASRSLKMFNFNQLVCVYVVLLQCLKIDANLYFPNFYKNIKSIINETSHLKVSEKCKNDLSLYINGLLHQEEWALEMFDATGKLQSGILRGNFYNLGHYSECMSIKVNKEWTIHGKYCLGDVYMSELWPKPENVEDPNVEKYNASVNTISMTGSRFKIQRPVKWAVCVPETCRAGDVKDFIHKLFNIKMDLTEEMCQAKNTMPKLGLGAIATITFFLAIICLVTVATIYDIHLHYSQKRSSHNILMAFSAFTNGKKLLQTADNTNQLASINGIKAFSMIWIMIGHEAALAVSGVLGDQVGILKWMSSKYTMYVAGSTYSTEIFLVLGGLLRTYIVLAANQKKNKFNFTYYYVHRFIRITPALAAMILVYVSLLEHLGSGPLYPIVMQKFVIQPCQKYWWTTLLYFQNYYNTFSICLSQSWYLCVDMQLFLITPLLILPLNKRPKLTISLLTLLSVLCMVTTFVVNWVMEIRATVLPLGDRSGVTEWTKYIVYYHRMTHTSTPAYIFGIILGYFVYQFKHNNKRPRLNKFCIASLWILSLTILFCVINTWQNLYFTEYNKSIESIYLVFAKPICSLAICWMVFACIFDMAGPLSIILSTPILQILGRLNYSMFLVHYIVILVRYYSSNTSYGLSHSDMFYNFCGDFVITVVLSFVWSLLFESPMIALEKILFTKVATKDNGNKNMKHKHTE